MKLNRSDRCKSFLTDPIKNFDDLVKNLATKDTTKDPFFSCINPDLERIDPNGAYSPILLNTYLANPQCIDPVCSQKGYKLANQKGTCNLQIQQCISHLTSNIGTATNSPVIISQKPECSQYFSGGSDDSKINTSNCIGEYDTCSTECGGGIQTLLKITTPESTGVQKCPLTRPCNTDSCPVKTDTNVSTSVNCEVSNWSQCSSTS